MPLRDHFRRTDQTGSHWSRIHHLWSATMVMQLYRVLPARYFAAPEVRLGQFVIDIGTIDEGTETALTSPAGNGAATAVWAPPAPTCVVMTSAGEQDDVSIQLFDTHHGQRLVAAIELVSPSNKDRPDNREAFVTGCPSRFWQPEPVILLLFPSVGAGCRLSPSLWTIPPRPNASPSNRRPPT